jgi:preprotein translocase subunit Sec61beta
MLQSPQSSAGIINFYDGQTNGPMLNPKLVLVAVLVLAVVIIIIDHFTYA